MSERTPLILNDWKKFGKFDASGKSIESNYGIGWERAQIEVSFGQFGVRLSCSLDVAKAIYGSTMVWSEEMSALYDCEEFAVSWEYLNSGSYGDVDETILAIGEEICRRLVARNADKRPSGMTCSDTSGIYVFTE